MRQVTDTHVMVDLETLGTRPDAVVVQIGLCAFDGTGETLAKASMSVNIKAQMEAGRTVDGPTISWWMRQSLDSRIAMSEALSSPHGLASAAEQVCGWFHRVRAISGPVYVWGHGATFDVTILSSFLQSAGKNPPFKFKRVRDTRTLQAALLVMGRVVERPQPSTAHVALDDAVAQAKWVAAMLEALPS